jgi:hypothetical protein
VLEGPQVLCEVKTINVSQDEADRCDRVHRGQMFVTSVASRVSGGVLDKVTSTVAMRSNRLIAKIRTAKRGGSCSLCCPSMTGLDAQPIAFFAGDVDQVGLDELHAIGVADAPAAILVFPHHGGRAGSNVDLGSFAENLCKLTRPNCIVFSVGRGKFANPDPEVVRAVRSVVADVRVACTQLSENCATAVPKTLPSHLTPLFARGRERNQCCAGTLVVNFDSPIEILPSAPTHFAFIQASAPSALCRRP